MTKIRSSTTKHLFAIGDSFTYGVGLDDLTKTYPHILAELQGMEVINDGFPGASHDRILRRTMSFVTDWMIHNGDKELCVIVGWGNKMRMEFYKSDDPDSPEDDNNYLRYTGLTPRHEPYYKNRDALEFAQMYYNNYTNKEASTTRALTRVLGLQSFLESFNIPFMFFNSVWMLPDIGSTIAEFVDHSKYYGFRERRKTFDAWTYDNGYRGRSELGHPDEEAHHEWAKHLNEYIHDGNLWS